jgi:multidrug efflux pump subunit AcrA (membrane-fusion protein)
VRVRITVANNGKILPGMYGKADFGAPQDSVLAIPVAAVVTVEEQAYIFVAKSDSEFERRKVTLVSAGADQAVVLEGLKEGETVVTSGAMLLKGLSFGF